PQSSPSRSQPERYRARARVGSRRTGVVMRPADRNFSIASLIPAVYLPTIVFEAALGAILPVIAVTSRELGGSLGQAGLVVALIGVGHIIGDVPAGTLAHRIGDRRAMLVAGGVMVLALVACALAPSL